MSVEHGYFRSDRRFLFLQIIEVITHSPLVSAGDLILIQRALGIALRGNHRLLISHTTGAFDADAFQRNAGHLTARSELALDFRRREIVGELTLAAIGVAPRVHVGPLNVRVIEQFVLLREIKPTGVLIGPGADAYSRLAPSSGPRVP